MKNGKIMLSDIGWGMSMHQQVDKFGRSGAIFGGAGGLGKEVLAVYFVDKGHQAGPELHWITDNGIIIMTNATKGNGLNICTRIPARPGQLERYPQGGSRDWSVCEQVFPDKDWKVPNWLLQKARRNQSMGLNLRESSSSSSSMSGYMLGDLLQDRQEMAWDYVKYEGDGKLTRFIQSSQDIEEKVKEAVYDAVAREVPDRSDDDEDFTKSCMAGMKAALDVYSRLGSTRKRRMVRR